MDFTTTGLYASIRRRASIPTTSTTGTANADLLVYANEELRLRLMADILAARGSYFLRFEDVTLTSATEYRIPQRAIGGKLASVMLLDSNDATLGQLTEIGAEQAGDYDSSGSLGAYYVRNQNLVLVPGSSGPATSLRLGHYTRPNELVATGYSTITGITTATNTIVVASSSGFSTSMYIDLVAATPGFETLGMNMVAASLGTYGAGSVTFTTSLPTDIAEGDYLCVAKQSPVPQIPEEYHPVLAQRVALKCLQAMGFPREAKEAQEELDRMEQAAGILISPRVDAGGRKIVNRTSALGSLRRGY